MVLHKSYTSLHPLAGSLTTVSTGESPRGLKLSLSCFLTNGGITKLSTGHSRALPKPYSPFSGYDPPSISVAPRNATKKTGLTSWKKRGLTPSTISHRIQAGLSYVNMLNVFVSLLLTG